MKQKLLFILIAAASCLFTACKEKNTPSNNEGEPENPTTGEKCGVHLYWSYDEDTYTLNITGHGDMFDYDTVGPWGKPVELLGYVEEGVMAGEPIYRYREIKYISLPEGLTHIGECAFDVGGNASKLTSIIIPSTVTSIGRFAFYDLFDIHYIKSLAVIPPAYGDWCFYNHSHISVYVPSQSVDAYKSAIGWQSHSIQAIP